MRAKTFAMLMEYQMKDPHTKTTIDFKKRAKKFPPKKCPVRFFTMDYRLDNLTDECPVMVTKLPKEIMDEIDSWVDYGREIKSHPLFMLRRHENYGENSYQLSVPPRMVQESFWLPLTDDCCSWWRIP